MTTGTLWDLNHQGNERLEIRITLNQISYAVLPKRKGGKEKEEEEEEEGEGEENKKVHNKQFDEI